MKQLVEIRSYRLREGSRVTFARLFQTQALPLLRKADIDVVGFGLSSVDTDAAFLIRAFANQQDRKVREDAFYNSPEWRLGPREPILACIEAFMDTLLILDERTIDDVRAAVSESGSYRRAQRS
jgi:hypothetical protein